LCAGNDEPTSKPSTRVPDLAAEAASCAGADGQNACWFSAPGDPQSGSVCTAVC